MNPTKMSGFNRKELENAPPPMAEEEDRVEGACASYFKSTRAAS
jgi:hypothetical protein